VVDLVITGARWADAGKHKEIETWVNCTRKWHPISSCVSTPLARKKATCGARASFVRHFMRSPAEMGMPEIRQFLLALHDRGQSPSTIKLYVASLHFLYAVTLERPAEVENIPWPRVKQQLPAIVKSRRGRSTARKNRAPRVPDGRHDRLRNRPAHLGDPGARMRRH
jgi:hypothetical protein